MSKIYITVQPDNTQISYNSYNYEYDDYIHRITSAGSDINNVYTHLEDTGWSDESAVLKGYELCKELKDTVTVEIECFTYTGERDEDGGLCSEVDAYVLTIFYYDEQDRTVKCDD